MRARIPTMLVAVAVAVACAAGTTAVGPLGHEAAFAQQPTSESASGDTAAPAGGPAEESAETEESGGNENSEVAGPVDVEGLSVVRAYICKGIEESEPAEAGKSFIPDDAGVWRLCCFSEIAGAAVADTVAHHWYWGDRRMASVRLPVGPAPRWRTWSSKKILEEWHGEWHVDIVGPEGALLKRLDFSVE